MEQYFSLINWDSLVDILKAFAAIGAGGGITSLLVSALVGANWPSPAKALVAFLMCLVGSFIPIAISGVDLTNLVLVLPLWWLGSQMFYRLWFKPHGIANFLETAFFNTKTDGPNPPPQPVSQYFGGAYDQPIDPRHPDHYRDQFHP
jgi:hypothetical protein